MTVRLIYAEKIVSATEVRKGVNQYFIDEPVAVLSNNKPTGYMVGAALFERMILLIEKQSEGANSSFRPATARLQAMAFVSEKSLLNATDDELGEFSE
ncbi:putative antitoxin of the YafO-YafN toxin-antitoxin system [Shewanella benthica]|uniref:Putative antitoxin of the YafO-YafN toxin-antitoxin system n=1 Tax=Shewanella benthica TaxID=43661 RepID=A0A330LWY2_9GAMM|nr:type I toxin-antitoxin system antitoxin YafN [Shewanella benthica]SQH74375.1 putative antitoxin of the YafO-YafN toxin-antitoxin system [Shewanella benthica]